MRLNGMIKNNSKTKNHINREKAYFDGRVVERYRADLGLSTFNDGRGIFDWNVVDGDTPRDFVAVELVNTCGKRDRRNNPGDFVSGNFVVTTDEGWDGFVLVKNPLNLLDNVERNVSFEFVCTIGCVKVFELRRDIVITQSRALLIDVFNWSSLIDEVFGAW
jgi:hypothetical protein